jgi:hypothetical protein
MTVETHGMQFVVDASGVAKGFRDYEAAVDGIFKSLDKFEKKVAQTMSGIERAASNRAALAGFKKSLDQFSNINIDTRAAASCPRCRPPWPASRHRTKRSRQHAQVLLVARTCRTSGERSARSRTLGSLKASMESFKAPPLSQANNLVKFAQASRRPRRRSATSRGISGVSGIANELASISIAMPAQGSERGADQPTSAVRPRAPAPRPRQHRQDRQMLHALAGVSNFKAPSPRTSATSSLRQRAPQDQADPQCRADRLPDEPDRQRGVAGQRDRLGGFRGNLGGFNRAYGRFNEGTRSAKVEMMGLQNAFSGTFQVGSVLRSLLGSLTWRAWPRVLPSHADRQPVPRRHAGPRRVADDERARVGARPSLTPTTSVPTSTTWPRLLEVLARRSRIRVRSARASKSTKASRPS